MIRGSEFSKIPRTRTSRVKITKRKEKKNY
jgi:hypothetical protein